MRVVIFFLNMVYHGTQMSSMLAEDAELQAG